MRFADNFNPEWGYLAPAPRFMRTLRVAVVAAAIGASAGGAVVFSLIERPAAEETSVSARTLVHPADSVSAFNAPQTQPPQPADARAAGLADARAPNLMAAESGTRSTAQGPQSSAALAEASAAATTEAAAAAIANTDTAAAADASAMQKKAAAKKQRSASREQAYGGNRAPLALQPAFAAPTTAGAFWQRSEY